jgi:hypothetical protein
MSKQRFENLQFACMAGIIGTIERNETAVQA